MLFRNRIFDLVSALQRSKAEEKLFKSTCKELKILCFCSIKIILQTNIFMTLIVECNEYNIMKKNKLSW